MTTAFPLQWPHGWPRTVKRASGRIFKWGGGSYSDEPRRAITFAAARDRLVTELRRLGAKEIILSTNHPVDRSGFPREARRKPDDEGVAVYFTFKGKPLVMACDRYQGAAANMASLRIAIDALRALERHGGGTMMERAFSGFTALPPNREAAWYEILGVSVGASPDDIKAAFRQKAKEAHPDAGGSVEAMQSVNAAFEQAMRAFQ